MTVARSIHLSPEEAAARLGVATKTMTMWRWRGGGGPRYLKPSRSVVLYPVAEIEAFEESRIYSSTSEETVARRERANAGTEKVAPASGRMARIRRGAA